MAVSLKDVARREKMGLPERLPGFELPQRRVTINLAPADLPKDGGGYDLPMAIGILTAMDFFTPQQVAGRLLVGELALDGRVKPVAGVLPAALFAQRQAVGEMVVPADNGGEAALVAGLRVVAPATLLELVRHLKGERPLTPQPAADWDRWLAGETTVERDLATVKGQEHTRRALEVVATGGHNLLMYGPPGAGKTLLARCLPGILPPLSLEEALEATVIHSVAGRLSPAQPLVAQRPFRAPHHTASQVALIGGGSQARPGEVSLAHNGVLFLDELPEFGRATLEVLRQPLEGGEVEIARAARGARYPARFQLVAACNPCPCGHLGDPHHPCRCRPGQMESYRSRLSGPLLDRIDLQVEVPPVPYEELVQLPGGESSAQVRERVRQGRARQYRRNGRGRLNAHLEGADLEQHAALDETSRTLLLEASRRLGFSARGYHRILRVARTIADLAGAERIGLAHLAEAIQFRVGSALH